MLDAKCGASAIVAVVLASPLGAAAGLHGAAQQSPAAAAGRAVRPIEPPAVPLPAEAASAGETRFSFIVYGDTRSPG